MTEKALEKKITRASGKFVVVAREVLTELWGTEGEDTMARADVFCEQHGFECEHDQKLGAIKFRLLQGAPV